MTSRLNRMILEVTACALLATPYMARASVQPTLTVLLNGKYRHERTQVYRSGQSWVCKTEVMPYFETPRQPFDAKLLTQLGAEAAGRKPAAACRDRFMIIDRRSAKAASFEGCADESTFARFSETLGHHCGR